MVESKRCDWCVGNALMMEYHDREWGVPLHDDRKLFEFMVLDAAQAGLSWQTVLNKRENYRKALHAFDPVKVSKYTRQDFKRLMNNPGIIRNRLKVESTIKNAASFLTVQKEFGSFNRYIWHFVEGKPIQNRCKSLKDIQAKSKESEAMSRDLLKRGFRFVGPTICYAFMQAAGMVNDHLVSCFRHKEVA